MGNPIEYKFAAKGVLSGLITDADTGEPVADTEIRISCGRIYQTKTDEHGFYSFDEIEKSNNYEISINSWDHIGVDFNADRPPTIRLENDRKVVRHFQLKKACMVELRVKDEDGKPVEDAKIHVSRLSDNRGWPVGAEERGGNGFTLLELLIVISIIALLFSIIVPCLMRAKESALELAAMQVEVDEEGKVRLEIRNLTNRKLTDDIYMIKLEPARSSRIILEKPHPAGMKLIKRDGQDYIKWRPKVGDIGVHLITVVFKGEEISEQEIKIYVFNKKLLEAERKDK